jgi:hypothetical protein
MKLVTGVLGILLFVTLASAREKQPCPQAGNPQDTVLAGKNVPDRVTCPQGKRMFPGHGMHFKSDMREPGRGEIPCPGFRESHRYNHTAREMRCCPPFPLIHTLPFLKILFLGLLLWGILNVLLTIIVSLDMTKNGGLNGLWIPVLLIAGIPGSIIYALFRIGDKLSCKGTG